MVRQSGVQRSTHFVVYQICCGREKVSSRIVKYLQVQFFALWNQTYLLLYVNRFNAGDSENIENDQTLAKRFG